MGTSFNKIVEKQPVWFQKEMKKIEKHDASVKKALKNKEMKELLLEDPNKFLKKLNIPLSAKSKSMMRKNLRALKELQKPHYFELEDGQVIQANIKINIK